MNVLELIAMFFNVLESVIPTLLSNAPKLWPYNYVTIDNCNFIVLLVIYLIIMTNFDVAMNGFD